MYTPETSKELLAAFSEFFDFDYEKAKKQNKRTFYIGALDYASALFKAHAHVEAGKPDLAMIVIHGLALEVLEPASRDVTDSKEKDRLSFSEFFKLTKIVEQTIGAWNGFMSAYKASLVQHAKLPLFDKGELTAKIVPPDMFLDLEEGLLRDLIPVYRFHIGKAPLNITEFQLSSQLIVSDSIADWLELQKTQQGKEDDMTRIFLFLKLEKILDYSYFVYLFRYRDHIWLATDMLAFGNPGNKEMSRRPERHRERSGHFKYVNLPYEFVGEVPDIRKKRKTVAKKGTSFELFTHPLKKFPAHQRLYIMVLAQRLLQQIQAQPERKLISTFQQHTNQLLLTGKKSVETDVASTAEDFEDFSPLVRTRVEELLGTISGARKGYALVKRDMSVVLSSRHYDPGWLGFPDRHENLTKWIALEENRVKLQEQLNMTEKERDKQERQLEKMIELRLLDAGLMRILFTANTLLMEMHAFPHGMDIHPFDSHAKKKPEVFDFMHPLEHGRGTGWHDLNIWGGEIEIGRYGKVVKEMCRFCGKYPIKDAQRWAYIHHYNQLVMLAGVGDRFGLPQLFRNFKAHNFLPYDGNCILDNVHPYSRLEDPMSRHHPNGFSIGFYTCGMCARKHRKVYQHYTTAVLNTQGKIIKADGAKPTGGGSIVVSQTPWRWKDE